MQHLTMKTVLCILHTKISHGTTLNALLLNGENTRIAQFVKEKLLFLTNKQLIEMTYTITRFCITIS